MGVEQNEKGQSLIEFLFVIPLFIGLIAILVRVNIVIQEGIVNQKFARSQQLFITYNSPVYPEKRFQYGFTTTPDVHGAPSPAPGSMWEKRLNQNINGVSENSGGGDPTYEPEPPKRPIYRVGASEEGENTRAVISGRGKRGLVRVRVTTGLCTHSIFVNQGGEMVSTQKAYRDGSFSWAFCNCGRNSDCTQNRGDS